MEHRHQVREISCDGCEEVIELVLPSNTEPTDAVWISLAEKHGWWLSFSMDCSYCPRCEPLPAFG